MALLIGWCGIAVACTDPGPARWQPEALPYGLALQEPERNPTTIEGISLGRKLFFDENLSQPRGVSCMSCHMPGMAFTDGFDVSRAGVSGRPLTRNAPTLLNLAWAPALFWDGGAADLESQAYGPLEHPDEMNINLERMEGYLRGHAEYPALFAAAFGPQANVDNVETVRALAQYQRTLISFSTPWDAYQAGDSTALSGEALEGIKVFELHCQNCHTPPLFTDHGYHNNGLDTAFPATDEGVHQGRYRITLDSTDLGKFKTPTLRNLVRTAPYMHDGRFETLAEVLDHYTKGIQNSITLDSTLAQGTALTAEEREALLVFLNEGLRDRKIPN